MISELFTCDWISQDVNTDNRLRVDGDSYNILHDKRKGKNEHYEAGSYIQRQKHEHHHLTTILQVLLFAAGHSKDLH